MTHHKQTGVPTPQVGQYQYSHGHSIMGYVDDKEDAKHLALEYAKGEALKGFPDSWTVSRVISVDNITELSRQQMSDGSGRMKPVNTRRCVVTVSVVAFGYASEDVTYEDAPTGTAQGQVRG